MATLFNILYRHGRIVEYMVIKLDRPIDCGMLCKQIQQLINKHIDGSATNKALSIRVVDVIDGGDQHIPKLEHKG